MVKDMYEINILKIYYIRGSKIMFFLSVDGRYWSLTLVFQTIDNVIIHRNACLIDFIIHRNACP